MVVGTLNGLFDRKDVASNISVIVSSLDPSVDANNRLISDLNAIAIGFRKRNSGLPFISNAKPSEILCFLEDAHFAIERSSIPRHEKDELLGKNFIEFYSACLCGIAECRKR